jgi:hypothetical protein
MPFLAAFATIAPEVVAAGTTAAEIAAAEAAAVAAAEAAAATAAQQAAATAAAESMGSALATDTAAVNAMSAPQAGGIMEIGGASQPTMTPAQLEYLEASTANAMPGGTPGQQMLRPYEFNFPEVRNGVPTGFPQAGASTPSVYMPEFDPNAVNAAQGQGIVPQQQLPAGFMEPATPDPAAYDVYTSKAPPPSSAFDKFSAFADKHPFMTGAAMYLGANKLGLLDPNQKEFGKEPYNGPLTKYRMSPDFKGSTATPNIYKPTYPTYAAGGIMDAGPVQTMSDQNNMLGYQQASAATGGQVARFARGGNMADSLDYYKQMMEGSGGASAPADKSDVGIYRDQDPDTMYQDALTAAQIRNAKISKRANLSTPGMKRPTPMGRINLAPQGVKAAAQDDVQEAAGGGIMGASNLGSYAAGGNPRLLKGPGDGMSDNIPAVIGRKQPARLADGEFVIPADVVSHLGNGSTDAGAKRLHEMMSKVRKDRTGNPKQGKQINAVKYMPK